MKTATPISAIHNQILKENLRRLEKEVRAKTPEIQTQEMMQRFLNSVNTFKFLERLRIVWRILWRKL